MDILKKMLIDGQSHYLDGEGRTFKPVGGSLDGQLGIAPAIAAAAISGGVKLIQLIAGGGKLKRLREQSGQLVPLLAQIEQENRQLDTEIGKVRAAIRALGLSGLGFCLFNCKKKKAAAANIDSLNSRIAAAKQAQQQKIAELQNLSAEYERLASQGGIQTASFGLIAGILMVSVVGGTVLYSWKNKKKSKNKAAA